MGKPIPDGYSYRRCDRFTRDEFLRMFTRYEKGKAKTSPNALKYVEEHPKEVYTTDDEVAIRSGGYMISPRGIYCGYGYTSKRYAFPECATGERDG
jgi:hypothetical protein